MPTETGPQGVPGARERRPLTDQDREAVLRDVQDLADRYLSPSPSSSTLVADRGPGERPPEGPGRLRRGRVCTSTNEYVIRGRIGEGGMGAVYRAFDQKLRRDVAFKVLLRPDDGDLLERFIREQEMTAALDHPNFVRVLSSGYVSLGDRSVPFYTMPLIRGHTLERLVRRRALRIPEGLSLAREYPLRRLVGMVGHLALTLQSAHDKRIVHRDLKPANVLVGPYGDVYVTDLGLAKILTPRPEETGVFRAHVLDQLARAGREGVTNDTILGTPYYMAPEQSLAPHAVDERADVFGLGALLYFVLTAERPRFRKPAIDPALLEARRKAIVGELALGSGGDEEPGTLAGGARGEVSECRRALSQEFEEVKGLLAGVDYYVFRLTMKECAIVPPGELLRSGEESRASAAALPPDPAIESVCMKALAKDPRDRYPSARAFWEAVHRILDSADRQG